MSVIIEIERKVWKEVEGEKSVWFFYEFGEQGLTEIGWTDRIEEYYEIENRLSEDYDGVPFISIEEYVGENGEVFREVDRIEVDRGISYNELIEALKAVGRF